MSLDYDGRTFRSRANSEGGDVDADTVFRYRQLGSLVWGTYEGGAVRFGTLVALCDDQGNLDMRYQHVAADGTIKTGRCHSTPELLTTGRLRLHESWEWTEGGTGRGVSVVEEE